MNSIKYRDEDFQLKDGTLLKSRIWLPQGNGPWPTLLMHSGLISNKALSRLTPQELVQKTGRFERSLRSGRMPIIDLKKAHFLIEKAKTAMI